MKDLPQRYAASAFALAAAALAAMPASAQDTQASPATASTESSVGLQEIIVTAQKRSENLQDVPISVVALTADKLASNRVMTSQDLQFSVPSLVYNQLSSFAQPYLRGIGSDITQPNADPSVATYIDGVFVSFNAGTITNLLGVERVEVLVGPQGTLYGRNAVGGAINIYTLTPKQELEGRVNLTYGNFNRTEGSAYVSGGITSNLAVGLYLGGTRRSSYLYRIRSTGAPFQDEPEHEGQFGARIKAVWTPTETLTLTGAAEIQITRSYEQGAFRNIQDPALAYTLGAPKIIQEYVISADVAQYNNTKTNAFYLREELDLGAARLLGITSYRHLKDEGSDDIDGTTLPLLISTSRNYGAQSRQFSQELQLLSNSDSKISWIIGAYYFHEKSGFNPNTAGGLAILGATGGGAYEQQNYGDVRTLSYAGFAQATAPLGDSFRLTLGGRYTIDKKKYLGGVNRYVDINGNEVNQIFDGNGNPIPVPFFFPSKKETWKKFTPKVTLDYKIADTLIYATYSKGFKAGVFNVAAPGDIGPVNPENLTNIEIGVKAELFDRRVRLNTAAYRYNFKDLQVQKVLLGSGGSTSLQNAASARAYGIESSLTAAVSQDFTLNASVAWEHATYRKFDNPASFVPGAAGNAPFPTPSSAAGNDLPRAPKWVFNLGADYKHELDGGGTIDASVNYYYNDGFYWESTNRFRQKNYNILNASVGYTFPGDHFSLRVFGSNLTNQYYSSAFILLPVSIVVQDAPPRMYGVTASAKF